MRKKRNCPGRCACVLPTDYGPAPYAVNVNEAARNNCAYRAALWTGEQLQMTLMRIPSGGEIGAETHPDTDQYLRVEEGEGLLYMGPARDRLDARVRLVQNCAVFVPAGTCHNIVNAGAGPLALSSVYAPPHHPRKTVQQTKADAEAAGH